MLLGDFYTINQFNAVPLEGQTKITAVVTLNGVHEIFKGHFPGQPVMPGVCMVQMIKEIAEEHLTKKVFLSSAANIKFLSVVNPQIIHAMHVEILVKQSGPKATEIEGRLFDHQTTFFKIKAVFEDAT